MRPGDVGTGAIDLSRPIRAGMMVYPGDPEVTRAPALTLAADGVAVERLACGSHTGTHVDAPCHSIGGGRTTSEIALEELIGPALVLPLDAAPGELISAGRLEHALAALLGPREPLPPRVLLAFGWDRHFGTELALRHPALSAEAAELLWSRGMRVLGTDALSPDPTTPEPQGTGDAGPEGVFAAHQLVLGRDGLLVENLCRLRELGPGIHQVGIIPLPLAEADGAPVRAVGWPRSDPRSS
ncbi:cyclase family protein [Nesterenkonia sp. F]|uniref:cyclase family protein n=1 Tax=Nesterenkonia sp. F TaxID=795955 RepID=UPI000255D241|nr:cyclase family protein [Nesterenkonia sp. F]